MFTVKLVSVEIVAVETIYTRKLRFPSRCHVGSVIANKEPKSADKSSRRRLILILDTGRSAVHVWFRFEKTVYDEVEFKFIDVVGVNKREMHNMWLWAYTQHHEA